MIYRYFVLFLFLFYACSPSNRFSKIKKNEILDFTKCVLSSQSYEYLTVDIPGGYAKKFLQNEGMCEYRFIYDDGAAAYISSDVWFGSSLNFKNRHDIGHTTYQKDALLDTIILKGIQQNDSLFWSEKILGDIMVGYINATENMKNLFEDSFLSIRKSR